MGIEVLPPDVQESYRAFSAHGEAVVFGLGGIKNVGDEAINEIVRAREEGGPYHSLYDLCQRVNLRKVTKRVLESLIKGGACDSFGLSRAAYWRLWTPRWREPRKNRKTSSPIRFRCWPSPRRWKRSPRAA